MEVEFQRLYTYLRISYVEFSDDRNEIPMTTSLCFRGHFTQRTEWEYSETKKLVTA